MRVSDNITDKGAIDWLCITLANTVENRNVSPVFDYLTNLERWIGLLANEGVLAAAEAAEWTKLAEANPVEAERVLAEAKEFREAMFRVFSRLADKGTPEPGDLAVLNARIAAVYSHLELRLEEGVPQWGWRDARGKLEALFWPAIHSAAQLLTSQELDRLRNCDGEKCTFLFVDRSKNHSRRWCTMDVCGNRAKSKRHYARVHGAN